MERLLKLNIYCVTLGTVLCACVDVEPFGSEPGDDATATTEQAGISMQGISMQGISMQGMSMQGFRVAGGSLDGAGLQRVRVERGELVAEHGGTTLRGTDLVGARLRAEARGGQPVRTTLVDYRIAAIVPELPQYDPTDSGHTFLYTLEQWDGDSDSWQPACPADSDGRRVAIPLAATWDERGTRIPPGALFTFACTTGVIAKCYRWGYRPWLTGYGDMTAMHWTCTRMARADYCGNGVPHTRNGTAINIWDKLPSPGPIQRHGVLPPLGMLFEAGWNTDGAVCLSHSRWLLDDGLAIAALCPSKLIPPGLFGTVCDTVPQVLGFDADARMFNEAYLNLF